MAAVITAVAFDEDNGSFDETIKPAYIRRLTHDFIVETKSKTLEFAHVSVKDYLQGEHQSNYSKAKCHAQVARTCLKYISSHNRAAYEGAMWSDKFLRYSHRYWGDHFAQLSEGDRQSLGVSKELLDWIIRGLCSMTFQDWLRAAKNFPELSTRTFTSDSGSPAFSACDWNLVEVLKELLSADPAYDLNLKPDNEGHTLLSLAACRGHRAVVELLIETKNVKVDSVARYNRTALHWASLKGHIKVVKLLLKKGADVNVVAESRQTPLHEASGNGHVEIVELLLKKGTDINVANNYRQTPLHLASENRHVEVVKLLLEKWADVNMADDYRQTPLHLASENGHVEVVKLLLEKGADVNAAAEGGQTPLYEASKYGQVGVVKLLLKNWADVNTAAEDGQTPLHQASGNGHVEVVKLLSGSG